MITRRRTAALLVLACVLAFAARRPILRAAGDWLVDVDPLTPADVAVAMAETGPAGQIELANLLELRVVKRVAVLQPEPDPAVAELVRRGVPEDSPARVLFALGVDPALVTIIPAGEGGTTDGTEALARWVITTPYHSLIVVTGADHSHRLRRALRRAMRGGAARVVLWTPALETFHIDSWWQQRRTLRNGLVELQKLALDIARWPLS